MNIYYNLLYIIFINNNLLQSNLINQIYPFSYIIIELIEVLNYHQYLLKIIQKYLIYEYIIYIQYFMLKHINFIIYFFMSQK